MGRNAELVRVSRNKLILGTLLLILYSFLFVEGAVNTNAERRTPDTSVSVYASRIGSSIKNSYDYFKESGAPRGLCKEHGVLMLENMFSLLSFTLSATSSSQHHYSAKVTKVFYERWKEMIEANYHYEVEVMGWWQYIPFGEIMNGKPAVYLHKKISIVMSDDGAVLKVLFTPSNLNFFSLDEELSFDFSIEIITTGDENHNRDDAIEKKGHASNLVPVILCICTVLCTFRFVVYPLRAAPTEDEDSLFPSMVVRSGLGWKLLASEVFRKTNSGIFLCSLAGAGAHFFCHGAMFALVVNTGSYQRYFLPFFILCYFVGGFVSGYFFMSNGLHPLKKKIWLKELLTCFVVTTFPLLDMHVTNLFQLLVQGELTSTNLRATFFAFLCCFCVGLPLSLCGTLCGRALHKWIRGRKSQPHVNQVPRIVPLPPNKFLEPKILSLLLGLIPYIMIANIYNRFLKCMFIYQPLMHHQPDSSTAGLLFIIATSCEAVIGTFTLLNSENHRWKWFSFSTGSSVSVFLFIHSLLFYIFYLKSWNIFLFQYYLIYAMSFISVIALIGGCISFLSASVFIDTIYFRRIKKGA